MKEIIKKNDEKDGIKKDYWLGATDEDVEGTWKWVTGKSLEVTDWGGDQPDNMETSDPNIKRENYLHIWSKANYKWNDAINQGPDGIGCYYLCEWD